MTANRVARASGLPVRLARRPFGVLRPADAVEVYRNPAKDLARLVDRGLLHKVATGYYAVVPPGSTDRTWLPSLEAAAYGIGFGEAVGRPVGSGQRGDLLAHGRTGGDSGQAATPN